VSHRRNLLIVRAGDDSLHPQWLQGHAMREFDLFVSYYGTVPDRYRSESEHYHAMRGARWPAHDAICRERAALLASYDFVAFACDDLLAGRENWNALFRICRRHRLDLAQPAIEGPVSHDITRPVEGCLLRYTNFVEIMSPIFSRRALADLKSSFGKSVSGWGLDLLWTSLLEGKRRRMAIIDAVRVTHTRALREGALYPLLAEQGIDAHAEGSAILRRLGRTEFRPCELSRIPSDETHASSFVRRLKAIGPRRRQVGSLIKGRS
jgi:hypothetical protein